MPPVYKAAAVVGCKIDRSKLFLTEDVRGCEHDLPQPWATSEAKFYGQCAKPLWVTIHKPILKYNPNKETLCGLRVFENNFGDDVVVGDIYVEDSSDLMLQPEMIAVHLVNDVVRNKIKGKLEPLNLWDEEQLGIWLITWAE